MPIVNNTDFPIVAATTSGSDLADRLNRLFDAYESNQFNPSRPLQLQKGGIWTRAETSGDLSLVFYDGINDHVIGTVSISGTTSTSQFGSGKPLALAYDITHDYKKDEIVYDKATQTYYAAKAAIPKGQPWNVGLWTSLDNVFNQIHQQADIEGLAHVGTTPPPPPNKDGQMWYDITDKAKPVFKVYHDGVWDNKGFGAAANYDVRVCVVGGGGACNFNGVTGGAAGGGEVIESDVTLTPGTKYDIIIGAAGGGNTTFGSLLTGRGAHGDVSGNGHAGGHGGKGAYQSGSGGGAGGNGTDAPNSEWGAAGGPGVTCSIDGIVYGAGGGGCGAATHLGGGGGGGSPNAGNGGSSPGKGSANATSAAANTGSGGGQGLWGSGANGVSAAGRVIMKIETTAYTGKITGSPTVSTSGTFKVLTWNTSGSYEA